MGPRLAEGEGRVEVTRGGVVATLAARPPLSLLNPKNHGRAAWVFVGNLGGGLVDGDVLSLDLRVAPDAAALLATQASTKVYKSARESTQRVNASVGERGLLVALPDPVVCFAGARYRQESRIELAASASLIWLEPFGAGRIEHGERWAFARAESSLAIARGGIPWLADGWLLDPAHGGLAARFGRMTALATLVVVGPETRALREAVVEGSPDVMVAPSPLGDDGLIVRFAAVSTQFLTTHLRERLGSIPALLGDDPFARKW